MALTKVFNCFCGQALSFKHTQQIQLVEGRELRDFASSPKKVRFKKNVRSLFHQKMASMYV